MGAFDIKHARYEQIITHENTSVCERKISEHLIQHIGWQQNEIKIE
jgi:hypothetical protein